jgi:DNA-binding IclR family transcriptional regulator
VTNLPRRLSRLADRRRMTHAPTVATGRREDEELLAGRRAIAAVVRDTESQPVAAVELAIPTDAYTRPEFRKAWLQSDRHSSAHRPSFELSHACK